MMVNTQGLKMRMKLSGLNEKSVADQMEMSVSSLSLKIHGRRPMYIEEVCELAEILGIDSKDYEFYFFANPADEKSRVSESLIAGKTGP